MGVETDGGGITAWLDQSRNHHRAIAHYSALRPILLSQGIGTYPGVAFAAAGDILRIADSPSLQFGSDDFVVEVVMRHSTSLDTSNCGERYGAVFLKADGTPPYRGPSMFANIADPPYFVLRSQVDGANFAQTMDGHSYNDDVPRLVGMYRHGVYLTLRINAGPVTTTSTPREDGGSVDVSAAGFDAFLGGQPDFVQCLKGVIAEVVAASPVSPSEMTALERYLLRKHATLSTSD